MDSRLDTAVTVEQLPVPIPLDSDRRPADLTADSAPGLNTIVQEIPQPPTQTLIIDPSPQESERQQDPTPETTTEAAPEAETPQVSEASQVNPTPQGSTPQDDETVQNHETPRGDEAPRESEASPNMETQNSPDTDSPPENADEHAYWVEEEEDTSVPDEAEMKEIESQAESDRSALECELSLVSSHVQHI